MALDIHRIEKIKAHRPANVRHTGRPRTSRVHELSDQDHKLGMTVGRLTNGQWGLYRAL